MHPFLFHLQQLAFPHFCIHCKEKLFGKENFMCLHCNEVLPLVGDYLPNNDTEKILFGRLKFQFASSLLYFQHDNIVQKLMHELKYNNNQEVGEWLGYMMGKHIASMQLDPDSTMLLPVPLSTQKYKIRGYNQSEIIAIGISNETKIPLAPKQLLRIKNTTTQTKKTREERYQNMIEAFEIKDAILMTNKHIILIDDIITTGATIEACGLVLQKIDGVQISVLVAAIANF
jgi:ComF family protein